MNGTMKLRVSLASLGFGVALLFAPSAYAQAESIPDHFTETGVEMGPGGSMPQNVARPATTKQASKPKPAAVTAAQTGSSAAPVHVAVVDKNRAVVAPTSKH
jgi:hypothetical protein